MRGSMEYRRGTGVAHGAVSIVNAISTGFGAAVGVDFRTVAEASPCEGCETVLVNRDRVGDDSLVREVVATILGALGVEGVGFRIVTHSDVPIAVGLKSSSSAAVAVGLAVLDALGRKIDTYRFLQLIADASQRSGVSITGAMDDAAACMLGGIVLTNNHERRLLRREPAPEGLAAAILVPPKQTFTKSFRKELLAPIGRLVLEAFRLAERGDYWAAMTLNGLLHAAALNIPTAPIIDALRAGALGAGVSGTGPAIAAVAPLDYAGTVADALRVYEGSVLVKRIVNSMAT
jgi:shikimate kinase